MKHEPRFEDELDYKWYCHNCKHIYGTLEECNNHLNDGRSHEMFPFLMADTTIEKQKRHQAKRDAWILERLHHSLIKVRTLKEWKHDYEHGASMLYNELKKLLVPLSSDVQHQSKGQPMKRKRIIQKSSINRLFGGGK